VGNPVAIKDKPDLRGPFIPDQGAAGMEELVQAALPRLDALISKG